MVVPTPRYRGATSYAHKHTSLITVAGDYGSRNDDGGRSSDVAQPKTSTAGCDKRAPVLKALSPTDKELTRLQKELQSERPTLSRDPASTPRVRSIPLVSAGSRQSSGAGENISPPSRSQAVTRLNTTATSNPAEPSTRNTAATCTTTRVLRSRTGRRLPQRTPSFGTPGSTASSTSRRGRRRSPFADIRGRAKKRRQEQDVVSSPPNPVPAVLSGCRKASY